MEGVSERPVNTFPPISPPYLCWIFLLCTFVWEECLFVFDIGLIKRFP